MSWIVETSAWFCATTARFLTFGTHAGQDANVPGGDPAARTVAPFKLFIIALLVQAVLPLTPLIVALLRDGEVSDYTLVVVAPLYALVLGTSCRDPLAFILGIDCGVLLLCLYGLGVDVKPETFHLKGFSRVIEIIAPLICFVAFGGIDRWLVHVKMREPFGFWHAS
jgi:hypothetical protein